jgi:hypothetical protein
MSDEGGFDIQAYRAAQSNPDRALLVTFEYAARQKKDGSFENIEMVRIWLGRNDEICRPVTAQDKVRFRDRYEAFLKGEKAPEIGTPIAQCALATPAIISACKAERIFTLEQLVETPDERLMRSSLVNFKYKCNDWLEAQKRIGHVGEMRSRIEKLERENEILKERLKADGKETEVKRRGRPPKVKDGDTAIAS